MSNTFLPPMISRLLQLVEWPFQLIFARSRRAAVVADVTAHRAALDDYSSQLEQTRLLLAFRKDVLLPLIEKAKNSAGDGTDVERAFGAVRESSKALGERITHQGLAAVLPVLHEGEGLDYRSDEARSHLDNLRVAIDDAERATAARRQELQRQYPNSPQLEGASEAAAN